MQKERDRNVDRKAIPNYIFGTMDLVCVCGMHCSYSECRSIQGFHGDSNKPLEFHDDMSFLNS